jgi:hypothetical protein
MSQHDLTIEPPPSASVTHRLKDDFRRPLIVAIRSPAETAAFRP